MGPPVGGFGHRGNDTLHVALLAQFGCQRIPLLNGQYLHRFAENRVVLVGHDVHAAVPVYNRYFAHFTATEAVDVLLCEFRAADVSGNKSIFSIRVIQLPRIEVPRHEQRTLGRFQHAAEVAVHFEVLHIRFGEFLIEKSLVENPGIAFHIDFVAVAALFEPDFTLADIVDYIVMVFELVHPRLFVILQLLEIVHLFQPAEAVPHAVERVPRHFGNGDAAGFHLALEFSVRVYLVVVIEFHVVAGGIFPIPFQRIFHASERTPRENVNVDGGVVVILLQILVEVQRNVLVHDKKQAFIFRGRVHRADTPVGVLGKDLCLVFLLVVHHADTRLVE